MIEQASAPERGVFEDRLQLVGVAEHPGAIWFEAGKRGTDIIVAVVGLIIAAPVLLIAMVLIWASGAGSPIFTQWRVGRHGKPFRIYKLRTMRDSVHFKRDNVHPLVDPAVTGPVAKTQNDPRVFPVGRFLRKTSIDELPNLVNVLIGDMSIVGPRPMQSVEIEYCTRRYGQLINAWRLTVKPGITCLWQISGRSHLHFDERVRLDVTYAVTWTPMADLQIILATIHVVLFGRGAY